MSHFNCAMIYLRTTCKNQPTNTEIRIEKKPSRGRIDNIQLRTSSGPASTPNGRNSKPIVVAVKTATDETSVARHTGRGITQLIINAMIIAMAASRYAIKVTPDSLSKANSLQRHGQKCNALTNQPEDRNIS